MTKSLAYAKLPLCKTNRNIGKDFVKLTNDSNDYKK